MTLFECMFMDEMQITIVIMHIHYTLFCPCRMPVLPRFAQPCELVTQE